MLAKTYFERIYPHTRSEIYYPSRKNHGLFISFCLMSAGSNYFPIHKGKRYTSNDVASPRKIYDGSRPITRAVKESFNPFDVNGLANFYKESIQQEKIHEVALSFGITADTEINAGCFCSALAIQFHLFIKSSHDEADDIVSAEYQKLLAEPTAAASELYQPSAVLYPGDQLRLKSNYRPTYHVNLYEKFEHIWEITNIGTQTWQGRKLYLSNQADIRPRATAQSIEIPLTPPHKSVKIAASMDTRGFEGKCECHWIMIDEQGHDCFPNSASFKFIIEARFEYKPQEER